MISWQTCDVFDGLASLEDGSIDLVATSPPFLALRSYLPSDHPDKGKEIGSEATPAEFLDVMLRVVGELRRVLAPHGSIAIELGDTMSGSGGAGGDYADDGWRNGQPRFGGSASRGRSASWSYPDALWLAGVIDTEGSIHVHRNDRGDKSPSFVVWVRITMMDREVCDRAAAITGVGNVTQDKRGAYTWGVSAQQARYVLTNIWPHLLIKQRQAKAAIELARRVEDFGGRGTYARIPDDELQWRDMVKEYVTGLNARGEDRGKYVPTWEPPTPHHIRHSATGGSGWPMSKSKVMIPELFRIALAYGFNPLTGEPSPAGRWRVRNVVTWCRPNPPVGALGDKWRPATSDIVVACVSPKRFWDDLATRKPFTGHGFTEGSERRSPEEESTKRNWSNGLQQRVNTHLGAPLLDYWEIPPTGYAGAHYAVYPPSLVEPLVKAMVPQRVCRTCGEPSRRIVSKLGEERSDIADAIETARTTLGLRRRDLVPLFVGHYKNEDSVLAQISNWELGKNVPVPKDWQLLKARLGLSDGFDALIEAEARWNDATYEHVSDHPSGWTQDASGRVHQRLPARKNRIEPEPDWTDCGHDDWRPGRVLDPFAGSGTTLAVASGHGHDAIGFDLDSRNEELARDRVGPLLWQEGP